MERSTLKNMKFGKEKLKNIWYFYKKQIIAGLLAAVIGTVMLVQCVGRENKELLLYFAGPVYFSGDAQARVCDAFDAVIDDSVISGVGMITTVFGKDLQPGMTDEERHQYAIDYTGQKETLDDFKTRMRLPDTLICILSRECFDLALEDEQTLRSLRGIPGVDPGMLIGEDYGIPLASLDFYRSNSILKNFPEDCVLCLKAPSVLRKDAEEERQIEAFSQIVSFRLKA